jgi:hypothetical protein
MAGHPALNYDFAGDPAVAIVANPVAQGYIIHRAGGTNPGVGGKPTGT